MVGMVEVVEVVVVEVVDIQLQGHHATRRLSAEQVDAGRGAWGRAPWGRGLTWMNAWRTVGAWT